MIPNDFLQGMEHRLQQQRVFRLQPLRQKGLQRRELIMRMFIAFERRIKNMRCLNTPGGKGIYHTGLKIGKGKFLLGMLIHLVNDQTNLFTLFRQFFSKHKI